MKLLPLIFEPIAFYFSSDIFMALGGNGYLQESNIHAERVSFSIPINLGEVLISRKDDFASLLKIMISNWSIRYFHSNRDGGKREDELWF